MKIVLSIVITFAILAIVACGPSAEEKMKMDAARQADSIAAAARTADSLAALEGLYDIPQSSYNNSSYDNTGYNSSGSTNLNNNSNNNYKYEYRNGTSGNYEYNYDVEGSDENGNSVTGNINIQGKYGSGTIEDENGNERDVDVEWTGNGTLEATDDEGNTYELNPEK
jgi:hypothetical protein